MQSALIASIFHEAANRNLVFYEKVKEGFQLNLQQQNVGNKIDCIFIVNCHLVRINALYSTK
jgi:hypothetical protein